MKNKKGVVEIQFNWIFVLIAGAVILLFFGYIVTQLRNTAEEKTSTTVLSNLETILTGAGVSTGTLNLIKLPKSDVEISCERFAIGSLRRPIESDVIFAPRRIVGRDLYTWTLEWAVPYRVINFLYLTSPNVRYVFVGDDQAFTELYKFLPDEINKEIVTSITSIPDLNDYEVRFIFFNIDIASTPFPPSLEDMDDNDVTAIRIDETEGFGDITFYQKDSDTGNWISTGSTKFLRKPSLIGAIFSDDYEDYVCNMRKAIRRLNLVSQVYQKRSDDLVDYYAAGNCQNFHDFASSNLQSIIDDSGSFDTDKFEAINDDAFHSSSGLDHYNYLAELSSCVLIY